MSSEVVAVLRDDTNPTLVSYQPTTIEIETVTFALDGETFEIHLSGENARDFRDRFAPYTAVARRVSGSAPSPRRRGKAKAAATPKAPANGHNGTSPNGHEPTTEEIRDWAKTQKIPVKERGRIAGDVTAQFRAAHT